MGPVKGSESVGINRLPSKHVWTRRSTDRKKLAYLRGFSFGPCIDLLRRKRIRGSSFIGNYSLESVSVLVGDLFRSSTHQLFVAQPGANPRGGERTFRGFDHTGDDVLEKYVG